MADYRARVVDSILDALLEAVGCVVLEGPKAVGKTATAARRAASEVRLDVDVNAREVARADPSLVLACYLSCLPAASWPWARFA